MKQFFSCALVCALIASSAQAQTANPQSGITTMVSEITDNRTTGKFFAGAEVKLNLIGEGLAQMRGVRRVTLTKAVDDTGKNLIKADDAARVNGYSVDKLERSGKLERTIKLENPSRKASVIKEVTGTIELLAPARDAQSVVSIKNLGAQMAKPLSAPVLKSNSVEITPMNKTQFDAMRKAQEAKAANAKAESGEAMVKALGDAFKQLFGGFVQVGENDLALLIKDPQQKLADIEVLDASGVALKNRGQMTTGGLVILSFDQKLPDNAELKVYLATPGALVRVPIALKDVVLP